MLHLFKKVYLDFKSPSVNTDRLNYTEGQSLFEMLCSAKLLDSKTKNKVVIVVKPQEFIEFSTQWFKSIFEYPTSEACFTILRCHLLKENYLIDSNAQWTTQEKIHIDNVEFCSLYNKVEAIDVSLFLEESSFEFLLSSYLYNNSFKQELKQIIHVIAKDDMENFILEIKDTILINSYNIKLQKMLGLQYYNYTNLDEIVHDEKLKWFFDCFENNKINWDYFKNVEVQNIFIQNCSKFLRDWVYSSDANFCRTNLVKLQLIPIITNGTMSDDELNEVIRFNLHSSSFSENSRELFNLYFLDHILEHQDDSSVNITLGNILLKPYLLKNEKRNLAN